MSVTRRSSDAIFGYDYEVQTLTCRNCKNEITRTVDVLGRSRQADFVLSPALEYLLDVSQKAAR